MTLTALLSVILSPLEIAGPALPDPEVGFGTSFADLVLSLAPVASVGPEHPEIVALATLDYAHVVVMLAYALTAASWLPGLKTRAKRWQA